MKRYTTSAVALTILAAATWSIAAPQATDVSGPTTPPRKRDFGSGPSIANKWVIISTKAGGGFDAKENVEVGEIGQRDYLVIPMTHPGSGARYHEWLPLDEVSSLDVYDLEEEAKRHRDKRQVPRAEDEQGQQDPFDGADFKRGEDPFD